MELIVCALLFVDKFAIGVSSIEDTKRLSKLITVDGWQPIDAKIKVDTVARLVNSIGGVQLYGNNAIVPLRELIQNASDAIRARRMLENESSDFGDIFIHIGKDENGKYIEVEDNGIGMSQTLADRRQPAFPCHSQSSKPLWQRAF